MKFRKIKLHNYRCFLDGEIKFSEKDGKNINLLIGPNGGGKTELLFSFWWVLYDLNFSNMLGKEGTPYAINSDIYKEIKKSPIGTEKSCSVELEFVFNDKVYVIKKICEYKKNDKKITENEYQELSSYNSINELSLPIRDKDEIDKYLNRMIPKSILYGIIFDGERMQRLASPDESSKNAIKGVISDITNVTLIEHTIINFKRVKTKLNKKLNDYARRTNESDMQYVLDKIKSLENDFETYEETQNNLKQDRESIINRCNEISIILQSNKDVKDLELKRKDERNKLQKLNDDLDNYYKDMNASLVDGYLLISKKLLDDVESIIKHYDVPGELTVGAVRNILKRDNCICGKSFDKDAKETLKQLLEILPPDDINSTLVETIRQTRMHIEIVEKENREKYKRIIKCEEEIVRVKEILSSISTQIKEKNDGQVESSEDNIRKLEEENVEFSKRKTIIEHNLPKIAQSIKETSDSLKILREKRDSRSQEKDESNFINKQILFIEKCLNALDKISEINKKRALKVINQKLIEAYDNLSEDADIGRKIHIIQYDEERMYQILVYLETNFIKLKKEWIDSGIVCECLSNGLTEDEIEEKLIIQCIDSSSTGQSKMNTLSFVKAILDYSNQQKNENEIEIRKEYPLIIDAPFGDIAGKNLEKSSKLLHTFTNQIILMLDEGKYRNIESNLKPYISVIYKFTKANNKNLSVIEKIKEV